MHGYNIESNLNRTLGQLDETLGHVGEQARSGFGLNKQVGQRPWLMLGAALAVGYVFGSIGGDDDRDDEREYRRKQQRDQQRTSYNQNGSSNDLRTQPGITYYPPVYVAPSSPSTPYTSDHTSAYGGSTSLRNESIGMDDSLAFDDDGTDFRSDSGRAASSQPQNGIMSMFGDQIDTLAQTAVETIRGVLRDTIRDAVPSMRAQVDELDRRDGRVPASSTSTTPSLREV